MEHKNKFFIGIGIFLLLGVFFLFPGDILNNKNISEEIIILGYCPTMSNYAEEISKENNYQLIEFSSASLVLSELNKNNLDKGLIGRKAKSFEINPSINEEVLESGYTLVSNKKDFIDYSQLNLIEIYTYLLNEDINELIPKYKINIIKKEEVEEKIKNGKIALIPWEDWNDDFELFVVMNGAKKVEEFRGVFLYS